MPSMLEIMQEERPEGGFVFNKSYTDGVNRKFRETMVDDYYATYDGKVAKINFDDKREPTKFFIVKPEVDKYGTVRVSDSNKRHYPLSRLVYSAWCEDEVDTDKCIIHLDTDQSNNSMDNLKQVTKEENIEFQRSNGVYAKNSTKPIKVLNTNTGEVTDYPSVGSFLVDINAPEYIISRTDTNSLKKLSKFKHLEIIKE